MRTKEEELIKSKIDEVDWDVDEEKLWSKIEERNVKSKRVILLWKAMAASILLFGLMVFTNNEISNLKIVKIRKTDEEKPKRVENKAGVKVAIEKREVNYKQEKKEPSKQKQINGKYQEVRKLSEQSFEKIEGLKPQKFLVYLPTPQICLPNLNKPRVLQFYLPIIPDQLMKKERLIKRFSRQIRLFNTEGSFDWKEINIEPPSFWVLSKAASDTLKY